MDLWPRQTKASITLCAAAEHSIADFTACNSSRLVVIAECDKPGADRCSSEDDVLINMELQELAAQLQHRLQHRMPLHAGWWIIYEFR